MSKPDWKDAPSWAQWLGVDSDGEGYWFSIEPEMIGGWEWTTDGVTEGRKCEHAGSYDDIGCPYLEPRP